MIRKLTPHGNSAALVIAKPIMEILHMTMDTPLEVSTDGKNLIVSPVLDAPRKKKFKTALKQVISKHDKTFAKLAQ